MSLLQIVRAIFGGYFFVARKSEKRANDLRDALIQDLRDFEARQ